MKSVITVLAFLAFISSSFAQPRIEQGGTNPPRLPQTEGEGWYKQRDGGTDGILNVCFINRDTGWAGTLWTTNGGKTWATYQDDRYVIKFIDSKRGWSYGKTIPNGIARTTDGGETWVESPTGRTDKRDAIYFYDSLRGYTSFNEEISRTTNGGKSWHLGRSNLGVVLSFACFDSIHVLALGDLFGTEDPPYEQVMGIAYTTDGGENWSRLNHLRMQHGFFDAVAVDSTTVIGVGSSIMRSTNRGWSWQMIRNQMGWDGISASDPNNMTAVGSKGKILRTKDGWKTYEFQNPNVPQHIDFYDVCFIDSTTGWAVGDSGIIIHTSDAGKTWVKQHPVIDILNTQVYPSPANTILTVGYTLPIPLPVIFTILDLSGREITTIQSMAIESQGVHFKQIPVHTLPSGSYWLRVRASHYESLVKFTIVR